MVNNIRPRNYKLYLDSDYRLVTSKVIMKPKTMREKVDTKIYDVGSLRSKSTAEAF